MSEEIRDKNIEVNGKKIGANSIIRLNVKTAIWIIATIFVLVMSILTYSYFDLKSDYSDFVTSVNDKVGYIKTDVGNIRLGQESIKGDIKLILYRLDNTNKKYPTNQPISKPILPPAVSNVSDIDTIQPAANTNIENIVVDISE